MSRYVKPVASFVNLRVEERLASGSPGCLVYGCCPDGYSDDCTKDWQIANNMPIATFGPPNNNV